MENNNQPPFEDGQRVIAIRNSTNHNGTSRLIKDCVYEVERCVKCNKCGYWNVLLVEMKVSRYGYSECSSCDNIMQNPATHCFVPHQWLAPLNPPRVSAIPELLKAPVEETLDAHPVKILIND